MFKPKEAPLAPRGSVISAGMKVQADFQAHARPPQRRGN